MRWTNSSSHSRLFNAYLPCPLTEFLSEILLAKNTAKPISFHFQHCLIILPTRLLQVPRFVPLWAVWSTANSFQGRHGATQWWATRGGNGVCLWVIWALCAHVSCEMTEASDGNLCPAVSRTPVFPGELLQDSPAQRSPDLWNPDGLPLPLRRLFLCPCRILSLSFSAFFFLPVSLLDTHAHIYRHNPHPAGPGARRRREMAPVIFPSFKWGSAAVSVTETPRGGHQTKEKPFTLYCPLPQRAHISFLYPSPVFFLFLPCSLHTSLSHFSSSPWSPRLSLYFIKLGVLTMPFEYASLSKIHKGQKIFKKGEQNERDSHSWGRSVSLFSLKQWIVRWK